MDDTPDPCRPLSRGSGRCPESSGRVSRGRPGEEKRLREDPSRRESRLFKAAEQGCHLVSGSGPEENVGRVSLAGKKGEEGLLQRPGQEGFNLGAGKCFPFASGDGGGEYDGGCQGFLVGPEEEKGCLLALLPWQSDLFQAGFPVLSGQRKLSLPGRRVAAIGGDEAQMKGLRSQPSRQKSPGRQETPETSGSVSEGSGCHSSRCSGFGQGRRG